MTGLCGKTVMKCTIFLICDDKTVLFFRTWAKIT